MILLDEEQYRDYPVNPDDEEYGVGASVYDLTGLIPSEPQSEDELDAYMDIYPYLPEDEK